MPEEVWSGTFSGFDSKLYARIELNEEGQPDKQQPTAWQKASCFRLQSSAMPFEARGLPPEAGMRIPMPFPGFGTFDKFGSFAEGMYQPVSYHPGMHEKPSNKKSKPSAESYSLEDFQTRVFDMAEIVRQALDEARCVPSAHLLSPQCSVAAGERRTGLCTLTAVLDWEHQHQAQKLLALAEEAVFVHTNRSCGVCLIGYKEAPFKKDPTDSGFTAELGSVVRKRHSCRKLFELGHCRHGDECLRAHPQFVSTLRFEIVIGL